MNTSLNIITLNIPYPPDYGGIIDSYYRLKGLAELGIKIHLHTFKYNRQESKDLEKYCEKIFYYDRDISVFKQFSIKPFIVKSRASKELLHNLLQNDYPILFDGLHVSHFIDHPSLKGRIKIVRAHNIEHEYYMNLAKSESNLLKKVYFVLESFRLRRFEKALSCAQAIATVSTIDQTYFMQQYGNAVFIPSSHKYSEVISKEGMGQFILYHGDLSVNENERIVNSIIRHIAPCVNFPFVIAGKNPSDKLLAAVAHLSNVQVIANPSEERMKDCIQDAHIHLLPAIRPCGLKLKLLYGLYAGRFCLVNKEMIIGTNLESACELANSNEMFIEKLNVLIQERFTQTMIDRRKDLLNLYYNPQKNALLFTELLNKKIPEKP
ncbi:MAG TPA: glycosyltransferase family 1 protein [Bacteroidales bacterium]|nr:glycosyltransferase family 1 protein [Bacteroidales bacterium]